MDDQILNDDVIEALRKVSRWFDIDRQAKTPFMEEFEEIYKIWDGRHWDLVMDDGQPLRTEAQKRPRANAVENLAFSLVEGLTSEFSDDIQIVDYPVEQGDEELAREATDLKQFIAYKNRLRLERTRWNRNYFSYGTGIWHIYWDPKWRGGKGPNRWVGDIRWKSLHPQLVYPDARCINEIEEGRRIHKAYYVTQEYIKEKWGKEVPSDDLRSDMLIGPEPTDYQEDIGEGRVLLVETWYKGEPLIDEPDSDDTLDGEIGNEPNKANRTGAGLHIIWWAGESGETYLGHANYLYYDQDEDVQFPFIFRKRYPRENSVWGRGELHFLKMPQIMLNKNSEMIIEGHAHESFGQTFYGENALDTETKEKIRTHGTMPGLWFAVKDIGQIKREYGRPLAQSLVNEPNRLQRTMETIVGRFDLSQGRTPSSVTAFRALDLLSARAQVRLRIVETDMTTSFEDCGNYINNLIYKCYTEKRKYRILGDDIEQPEQLYINPETGEEQQYIPGINPGQEWEMQQQPAGPQYGTFSPDSHKKAYLYDTDQVIPYEEVEQQLEMMQADPEMAGMFVEGEDYEVYSPEFDVLARVSTALPTDRAFYMEIAKELYAAGAIDGEVFWYVIQYGKFPPYEDMIRQEQEKKAMMQEQAAMEQQAMMMQQGQGMPEAKVEGTVSPEMLDEDELSNLIKAYFEQNPDAEKRFMSLSPEEQVQVIAQMIGETEG